MLKAPARLAVATKSGGGGSKLLVFMVAGGPGGATPSGQQVQLLAKMAVQVRGLGAEGTRCGDPSKGGQQGARFHGFGSKGLRIGER